jgi:hypothetical protein
MDVDNFVRKSDEGATAHLDKPTEHGSAVGAIQHLPFAIIELPRARAEYPCAGRGRGLSGAPCA